MLFISVLLHRTTLIFILFATQVLVNMKVLEVLNWPWWLIFTPLMVYIAIIITIILIVICALCNMPKEKYG